MIVKFPEENVNAAKPSSSAFKTETSLSPRFNTGVSIQIPLNSV